MITIDEKWCKGCGLCIWECPKHVLEMDSRRNEKGYTFPVIIRPELCIECCMCERICPENCIEVCQDK